MFIKVMDNRGDFKVSSIDVGAEVTRTVGAVDGVDVFLPNDGTIDGTELMDGDCVGNRVVGVEVEGTWTGVLAGAEVTWDDIKTICPFHTSNRKKQLH
jgi:hypothetical protein